MSKHRQPDGRVEPEGDAAFPYHALTSDPKILAVIDTVRRVSGVPTGGTSATFAPAQIERSRARTTLPPQQEPRKPAGRGAGAVEQAPSKPAPRRQGPVAVSLGPAGRGRGAGGPVHAQEKRSGPARGLLFGALAALLLHLAVLLALGGGDPVLTAGHDAGSAGTTLDGLLERVGLNLPT